MKRFVAIAALLLLAGPLLAAMTAIDYKTSTTTGGPPSINVGYKVDGTDVKFLVKLTSAAWKTGDLVPADICVYIAVVDTAPSGTDWKGADIAAIDITTTQSGTIASTGGASIYDGFCGPNTAASSTCTLTADATPASWTYVGSDAADKVKLTQAATDGNIVIEVKRPLAAGTAGADLAFADGTSKIAVGYATGVCTKTTAANIATVPTYTMFDTAVAKSFGSLTVLSWIAIALAALFLN